MPGGERTVYSLRIRGESQCLPHPHVDLSGAGPERLVVPCFSCGGPWVEAFIQDQRGEGFDDDQIFVRLDNQKHVISENHGKEAYWLTAKVWRYPSASLNPRLVWGTISGDAVVLIAKSLLRRQEHKAVLSPNTKEMLRQIIEVETTSFLPPSAQSPAASPQSIFPIAPSHPSTPPIVQVRRLRDSSLNQ